MDRGTKWTFPALVIAVALLGSACGGASSGDDDSAAEPASTEYDASDGDATTGGASRSANSAGDAAAAYDTAAGAEVATAPPAEPTQVLDDSQSTFALDIDGGSYTRCRSQLEHDYLCNPNDVRTEEFVNFFDMDYDGPKEGAFAIHADGGPTGDGRTVLRVGLQARQSEDGARKRAVLTFVIDISGSMAEPGKLDVVKESLRDLVDALNPDDKVAIVVYSENSRVLLPATSVEQRGDIQDAIASLSTESATDAKAGLVLGYQTARDAFEEDATNRVILASDGLANQGDTTPETILPDVRENAGKGIQLLTLGFGYGAYNDPLMEQLADQGDGFYSFVDGPREAQRLFRENLAGTLETIALDAKVQVTFDPAVVTSYRLLGYDNRAIADDQFLDDTVDAGEIGTGHNVTALYEVEFAENVAPDAKLGSIALRWKTPVTLEAVQLDHDIARADVASSYEEAPVRFRLAVTAARFAEALRAPTVDPEVLADVQRQAEAVASTLPEDTNARELADLVAVAVSLVS